VIGESIDGLMIEQVEVRFAEGQEQSANGNSISWHPSLAPFHGLSLEILVVT
jgi:hypothetical protein